MPELAESRVAVYFDFDNIVISRYDQLHGRDTWRKDEARRGTGKAAGRLEQARVDIGAILDYASSYGTVALTRAYADWSVSANAAYKNQLVDRAIDLTQLFPATATKNGADIRLAVDVVDDLFRLPDLTHVVIVGGDSDYIALAQRCKRLGRFVIGIGVTGSTSPALVAACDEFEYYDAIPGRDETGPDEGGRKPEKAVAEGEDAGDGESSSAPELSADAAERLLARALELGHAKNDDDWLDASAVKSQIKRMNPSFNEKTLGFKVFTDFVRAHPAVAELKESGQQRLIRLVEAPKKPAPRRRRAGTRTASDS